MKPYLAIALLALSAASHAQVGPNLLRNPGGELYRNLTIDPGQPTKPGSGTADFDYWVSDGTVPQPGINDYVDWPVNAGPPPEERGVKYFIGGPRDTNGKNWFTTQTQTLAAEVSLVDTGLLGFRQSGWLGGFATQNDRASYTAFFLAADGQTVLGTTVIGPVTNLDRGNRPGTELLFREATGLIPVGTRFVRHRLDFIWENGFHNGCADLLGFQLLTPGVRVAPDTFTVRLGRVARGTEWSLAEPDGDALRLCKFVVPNATTPPINVEFDGWTSLANPGALRFRTLTRTTSSGAFSGTVELWDWILGRWDPADAATGTLGPAYRQIEAIGTGALSRYVQDRTGSVRARLRVRTTGVVASQAWCADVDQAVWFAAP